MLEIKTIKGRFTSDNAKGILERYDPNIKITGTDEIYYPYTFRRYNLLLAANFSRLSKLNKYLDCSIDMVVGRPALAKGTPSFEIIRIEEDKALEVNLSQEGMDQIGHNFAMTYYLNKSKILRTPKIEIESEESFYKRFYIVHCLDNEEKGYSILLDSLDGNISLLQ